MLEGTHLGCTLIVQHRIKTIDNVAPICKPPYRVPQSQREVLKEQIEAMLEEGIIKESQSPWSAPVIMVAKKNTDGEKKIRVCIDYRSLNLITVRDYFPLPAMLDTLDQLGNAELFSTLDMASGYWQIEVYPEDQEKTAFSTPDGHYECLRMPFGLANSPSSFQRLMYVVLGKLRGKICLCYLDDVVTWSSNNLQEHIKNLRDVFEKLREANLKLQPSKCRFMLEETNYLGHIISSQGVKVDPGKVEVIKKYPAPKNAKEIRMFLGMVGFYRRYVGKFAELSKPLVELTKKGIKFVWSDEVEESFNKLRQSLCTAPVLRYPDFTQEFFLSTDASNTAISAILSQKISGFEHPIAFASRVLNKSEINRLRCEAFSLLFIWTTLHDNYGSSPIKMAFKFKGTV
jgi:hypothetical protein